LFVELLFFNIQVLYFVLLTFTPTETSDLTERSLLLVSSSTYVIHAAKAPEARNYCGYEKWRSRGPVLTTAQE